MWCAATCILSWKVVKEQAGCPQCKAPFSTLFTYRSLDGTLHDFPQEESVCLLARAQWFAAHLKVTHLLLSSWHHLLRSPLQHPALDPMFSGP